MSKKAQQFVDDWIENNVHAESYQPEGDNSEAQSFAEQCRVRAEAEGIDRSEIEDAVGDLVAYMADAIERVNDERVRYLSDKDG